MTTLQEPAPRRRARRLWLALTGVLLLVVTWAICWWWFLLKPIYDERRPFVGTWRLESPSPTSPARPELVSEMDLRLDGTKMDRLWDPQTGVVAINQPSPERWRVSNGRFQEVIYENVEENPLLRLLGAGGVTHMLWDSPVTWEGPDRFRVQGPSPKHQTMIWSRCEGVTGLPLTHIPTGLE